MQRVIVFIVVALAAACASRPHHASRSLPHPTMEEFVATIAYPYHASPERALQIERATQQLRKGMPEAEVVRIAGLPDYKAPWSRVVDQDQIEDIGEIWFYVHTWEKQITPDYTGKILHVALNNKTSPRVILDFAGDGL